MNSQYMFPKKSDLKKIDISFFSGDLPELKNITQSKSVVIANWLKNKIAYGLNNESFTVNNILPSKSEFAYILGVSVGTMQNALRYLENKGYVESKQCIGTLVRDYKNPQTKFKKLTSKREIAKESIKNYILKNKFNSGDKLPSTRIISSIIKYSQNTTRLALENLVTEGIIEHRFKNSNEYGWIVKNSNFSSEFESVQSSSVTLVDKLVSELEFYINENLQTGDKMPPHDKLAFEFKTSTKTVHDALKVLISRGILLSRRGRYGTTVINNPSDVKNSDKKEWSIFAPAQETAFYHYEKTQNAIKKIIAEGYNIGDKLPSIAEMSKSMDLSPNTIRKAFHNLAKEGYLVFSRGRYGGTFVIDIPEIDSEKQTFKWLAVNPEFKPSTNRANVN